MACSGAFATSEDYEKMFSCGELSSDEAAEIDDVLQLTAGRIHAVLAQTGQCDCSLSSWGLEYLKFLNIREALINGRCRCGLANLSQEERVAIQEQLNLEYADILSGKVDLCDGATGRDYPAADIIQQALTPFNAGRIVWNDIMRRGL